MKSIHCLFLLCLLLLSCDGYQKQARIIEMYSLNTDVTADVVFGDATQDTTNPPFQFRDGIAVYLATGTTADDTTFTDPDGNVWEMSDRHGTKPSNLLNNGFTENWFVTPHSAFQRYFYKIIIGDEAPTSDPMVDGSDLCVLLLDAGSDWYLWLRRTADTVPCPTVADCDTWLPSAIKSQP